MAEFSYILAIPIISYEEQSAAVQEMNNYTAQPSHDIPFIRYLIYRPITWENLGQLNYHHYWSVIIIAGQLSS